LEAELANRWKKLAQLQNSLAMPIYRIIELQKEK
jgi:hypothetical protein